MKCIRNTFAPHRIKRVSDALARKVVLAGMASYAPKHEWKREVRDNG
jgi:hypothetical protein